jgi:hypothetical protein
MTGYLIFIRSLSCPVLGQCARFLELAAQALDLGF